MNTQESNPTVERDVPRAGLGPKDILLAMVGLIGSIITSGTAYVVAKTQSDTKIEKSDTKIEESDKRINELIDKSNEFKRLMKVQAHFTFPKSKTTFTTTQVDCSGTVDKDFSEDFHLWIAVEVDGFIFFKGSEIEVDRQRGEWKKTIFEPVLTGRSKEFNLRLYAATNDGDLQIKNWMEIGTSTGHYERIATISNTVSKDHADVMRIKLDP